VTMTDQEEAIQAVRRQLEGEDVYAMTQEQASRIAARIVEEVAPILARQQCEQTEKWANEQRELTLTAARARKGSVDAITMMGGVMAFNDLLHWLKFGPDDAAASQRGVQ
jgi:pyruvate kinase